MPLARWALLLSIACALNHQSQRIGPHRTNTPQQHSGERERIQGLTRRVGHGVLGRVGFWGSLVYNSENATNKARRAYRCS